MQRYGILTKAPASSDSPGGSTEPGAESGVYDCFVCCYTAFSGYLQQRNRPDAAPGESV